jgi:monofunctional glycosyltransferase
LPGKGKKKASIKRRLVKWIGLLLLFLMLITALEVLVLRFVNPPFTAFMAWRLIRGEVALKGRRLDRSWRSLGNISPNLRRAVVAGEDQRFLSHHGFDFTEMNEAIKDMASNRGFRGASTITMQVARTVFLWPDRTWSRKIVEAYYTLLIELFWSKERILEMYLNTVDWGPGIVGAESASRRYFYIPARRLSMSQAALLASILPNPHRWSPTNPNARVRKRQKRIMRDMTRMPLL